MRKNILYRLGIVAILSGGLGFMTVAADHDIGRGQVHIPTDMRGPVHALDEVRNPASSGPSIWI